MYLVEILLEADFEMEIKIQEVHLEGDLGKPLHEGGMKQKTRSPEGAVHKHLRFAPCEGWGAGLSIHQLLGVFTGEGSGGSVRHR